jgi:UDP-N-acetylmuramate: L-alanyl-gamma-D-glutamyl-meso-diaminopimelate ligase
VYDDFAHHPTAMRTTIDGLRRRLEANPADPVDAGARRILAVFEPRSNTMKLGSMKAQLPWALEGADLSFCLSAGLGWDPRDALRPLGALAEVHEQIDRLVERVVAAARPGDHVLCMSNGGFGGIHGRLLDALRRRVA